MGIGVDSSVYDWISLYAPGYLGSDYYIGYEDGYYWFSELPDGLTEINGAVYTVPLRPSQNGIFIGNLA